MELKNATADQARKVFKEIKEKEETMKKLEKAVADSDEAAIKAALQKADQLRIKKTEPALQKAEKELKRIQEERKHVDYLKKVLSIPPNGLFNGVNITDIGEVAINQAAQNALQEAMANAESVQRSLLAPCSPPRPHVVFVYSLA